jgi:hypothetical protein
MPLIPLRWAMLALASVSIRCGDATGPREVPLQFEEIGTSHDPIPVIAEGGVGTIEVTGSILGGCDPLGAVAERRDGRITLEVGASRPRRLCALVALPVLYRATLIGLEPGFYRLTVLHTRSGGSAERVLREEVDVR